MYFVDFMMLLIRYDLSICFLSILVFRKWEGNIMGHGIVIILSHCDQD